MIPTRHWSRSTRVRQWDKPTLPHTHEKYLVKAVLLWLRAKGCFAWRQGTLTGRYQSMDRTGRVKAWVIPSSCPGVADILGVYEGRFLAIEVKRPHNKPTDAQLAFLQAVREHGGIAWVIYDIGQLEDRWSEIQTQEKA